MSSKPESTFIAAVGRHLPAAVYREKMANPWRRGTPDVYYEGSKNTLFVEYKWYPKLPAKLDLCDSKSIGLSKHQQAWLARAEQNNRSVAVIVGSPSGGLILTASRWQTHIDVAGETLLKPADVAGWICQQVQ